MSTPILTVNDLNIEFHDHLIPETVVYDFNLTLYAGETVGIVGESGSGKSMCALAIAGLLRRKDMKKSGEIIYNGHNLLSCSREILRKYQGNDLSIVFQEPMTALNPVKKIGQQIEESLKLHTSLTKNECYEKTIKMLSDVELNNPERIYRQYAHELSGGMRQRVMIAMAMICEPKILIADEITTALDVIIESQIIDLLKRLNNERKTAILFISHDLNLVKKLCERVIVMQGGYVMESGATEEVFRNPQADYTKSLINAGARFY
ncbi:MAG: ABC transporter ATP-binding protein [Lachnospiraceae bacterium]|nr:ABC transporter ATP-binding protein [Lachnospiraceae bacterium]